MVWGCREVNKCRKFNWLYSKPEQFIGLIDGGLGIVKRLLPRSSSTGVYHVLDKGRDRILKVAHPEDVYAKTHLRREERVLRKLSDVMGITHLVKVYSGCDYLALLKEFANGDFINCWRNPS